MINNMPKKYKIVKRGGGIKKAPRTRGGKLYYKRLFGKPKQVGRPKGSKTHWPKVCADHGIGEYPRIQYYKPRVKRRREKT